MYSATRQAIHLLAATGREIQIVLILLSTATQDGKKTKIPNVLDHQQRLVSQFPIPAVPKKRLSCFQVLTDVLPLNVPTVESTHYLTMTT